MQFFNLIVVALASFAAAAPNPATPEAEEVNIEKRCSGNYGPCASQADCCSPYQCFTKGGYCV
ncbi:unnamed protein product [Clonostachys rhizophaga]|uniref:Uncharacterized protein n=1 Tax=Clonostachys rhizophaga TaxID=160324 RepID=A0A9N9VA31_9HYPO|nr:unnamed protein product [Clonostachys rhizophaga]